MKHPKLPSQEGLCLLEWKKGVEKLPRMKDAWDGAISQRVLMGLAVSQVWEKLQSGISVPRASISLCGTPQGDDQSWDEHCTTQLLPWLP